jgi:uncharacterized protein (UPF0333 family)
MRKAQGALEYLIIIAAVLAIAAIVVLFLTGAFKGSVGAGNTGECKTAAASCGLTIAGGGTAASCLSSCMTACKDAIGNDVLNSTVLVNATSCSGSVTPITFTGTTAAGGCSYCARGSISW